MAPAPRAAQRRRGPTVAEARKVINVVPDADVKRFLASELCKDEGMMGRFGALARRSLDKSRGEDHYAKVERMIRTGLNTGRISDSRPRISLAKATKDARAREGVGDYAEAARIYGQVASAIIDSLPHVYVATDELWEQAVECIQAMGRCAEKEPNAGARMRIAKDLATGHAMDYNDACTDDYKEALGKAIHKEDDKKRLRGVIEEILSGGPPAKRGRDLRERWVKCLEAYAEGLGNKQGSAG